MKRHKRFKQSYKSILNGVIEDNVYPSTRYHLRKQVAYVFGVGDMWEWANNIKLSSKLLYNDLK